MEATISLLAMTFLLNTVSAFSGDCVPRDYGNQGTVCVCSATYCDTFAPIKKLQPGQYASYTSSMGGLRFKRSYGSFTNGSSSNGATILKLDRSRRYQTIFGFGGAFTDSAGINILSLSKQAQENLLRSYFAPTGIEYNFGRVPIAGCDFSTHTYTYDDVENDAKLTKFNLTKEDFKYKIPLIKRAQEMSDHDIWLVASPWTAPPWMKTNHDYSGFGFLMKEYEIAWTNYLMKFLDAYALNGVSFWALTTGNEPLNGIIPVNRFNSMGWTPTSQRAWIAQHLGPALNSSKHNTFLIAFDDQRLLLPWWMDLVMDDQTAANYIAGIGVHWYWDTLVPVRVIDELHSKFPDKFILSTEASIGDKPWEIRKVLLGSWYRAEKYIEDILENLNHWVTGWIDWNLALDLQGGPNWAKNYVDAAVIVNATADEFYKQPMFYALGHFTKFIPRDSIRVALTPSSQQSIRTLAIERPDKGTAIVLYNKGNTDARVKLVDEIKGTIVLELPKRSITSVIYW